MYREDQFRFLKVLGLGVIVASLLFLMLPTGGVDARTKVIVLTPVKSEVTPNTIVRQANDDETTYLSDTADSGKVLELVEKRTESSKTYYLGENRYRLETYMGAIHYKDSEHLWQDIDTTASIADTGAFSVQFTELPYVVKIGDDSYRRIYPDRNDLSYWIDIGKPFSSMVAPTKQGSTWTWDFLNASLSVKICGMAVKLDAVLKNSNAPKSMTFPFSVQGITRSGNLLYHNGKVVAVLEKPYATDAKGTVRDLTVSWAVGSVTVSLDTTGLVYPIAIDPTLNLEVTGSLGDTFERFGDNLETSATTTFGYYSGGGAHGGLLFAVPIIHGATVTSANTSVYCIGVDYDDPYGTVYCEDTDDALDFDDANPLVTARDRTSANTTWNEVGIGAGWVFSPDISGSVQEVLDRENWVTGNNLAVLLIGGLDSLTQGLTYYQYDQGPGSYPPKLNIQYEVNIFALTTHLLTYPSFSTANLSATLALGGESSANVSFQWGIETGVYTDNSTPEEMTEDGDFYAVVENLDEYQTYYFRPMAVSENETVYGDEVSFKTRNKSMYWSSANLTTLKSLTEEASHSAMYDEMEVWCNDHVNDAPPGEMIEEEWNYRMFVTAFIQMYIENMTFMYQMTDNTTYRDAALEWTVDFITWTNWGETGYQPQESPYRMMLTTISTTVSFAYYTLYEEMSSDNRTDLRDKLITEVGALHDVVELWNVDAYFEYPANAFSLAVVMGLPGVALQYHDAGAQDWIDFGQAWCTEGLTYLGQDGETWEGSGYQTVGLERAASVMEAYRLDLGIDLFTGSYVGQVPQKYLYFFYNGYPLQLEDKYWGISDIGQSSYGGFDVGFLFGRVTAFLYLFAAEADDGYGQWIADQVQATHRMLSYVWKDPNLTATEPSALTLTKYFQDHGYVVWKSGWEDTDLVISLKSGTGLGHGHPSSGEFGVYLNGYPITVGVGYELECPMWEHNVIEVDENGTGQTRLVAGDIITVEENLPYHRYALLDPTAPYEGEIIRWYRHVVYVEGEGYFIVYDDIEADSEKQFDWLLHAPYLAGGLGSEPAITLDGDMITIEGSGGGYVNAQVFEPVGFTSNVTGYFNDQSLQCYYASVGVSANATHFLTAIFPSTDNSTIPAVAVSQSNCSGVIVTRDAGTYKDLILFSSDNETVDEWIELGGTYVAADDGEYEFNGTQVRAQFTGYAMMRLEEGGGTDPPVVESSAASLVAMDKDGITSGHFNGNLTNLGSASSANVSFEYGLTAGYGSETTPVSQNSTGAFWQAIPSSLTPGETYHVRAKAVSVYGTSNGTDQTFTFTMPSVTTSTANTSVGGGSANATIRGNVTGMGVASGTYVFLQYGLTLLYGSNTTAVVQSETGLFSANVEGLTIDETYHYRAVVRIGSSSVYQYGDDATFDTSGEEEAVATTDIGRTLMRLLTSVVALGVIIAVVGTALRSGNWVAALVAVILGAVAITLINTII